MNEEALESPSCCGLSEVFVCLPEEAEYGGVEMQCNRFLYQMQCFLSRIDIGEEKRKGNWSTAGQEPTVLIEQLSRCR
jgi:hypothetical protein